MDLVNYQFLLLLIVKKTYEINKEVKQNEDHGRCG